MNAADLKFGNVDARHEILSRDPAKRRMFINSFFIPDSFCFDEFSSGEKHIIVGPKGSGKTAYLRYLKHKLDEDYTSESRFIIFRDDVTTQERDKIVSLSGFRIYDALDTDTDTDLESSDCSSAWQLFIHREIATLILKSNDMVAKSPDVMNYVNLIERFFSNFKTSTFKKILQRVTKGRIKVAGFGQEMEAEANFVDDNGNIDISEYVRYCNNAVQALDFNALIENPRFNIFFDEINISFVSGNEFRKNAVLIRDLVSACGMMNSMFAEHQLPIYIYSAIRSEVVDSVESSVRELQKWIDDKAVHIDWMQAGKPYEDQPFIELLRRRIQANVDSLNGSSSTVPVPLSDYFEDQIFGKDFWLYIIFESWARPRDLVRMMTLAGTFLGRGQKFNSDCFFKSKTEYSKGCWDEKKDELNSKYSQTEIEAIKRILTGFQTSFTLSQLESRITYCGNNDSRTKQFVSGRIIEVLLEDLFKVGVLGNMIKKKGGNSFPAFLYTGHSNFSTGLKMCVHRSLWRELQLEGANGQLEQGLRNFSSKPRRPVRR